MYKNKKVAKYVSIGIVAFFVLGVVGIAVSQFGRLQTAAASSSSSIGVVDMRRLITEHPDYAKGGETMKAEIEQAKKDFADKSANMNDKEKQDYSNQLQQRLNAKEQELLSAIQAKVQEAIKATAEARGLSVVLDKSAVVYGGQDITDDVIKKFGK